MKVKIGGQVYDAEDAPIMLIFGEGDKQNIAAMAPSDTKYAVFPDDFGSVNEMGEWMMTVPSPTPKNPKPEEPENEAHYL